MTETFSIGPVSKALRAELRTWVRKHGLVVWLDLDGHYSGLVDRLMDARAQGELPYDVKAFRGSHLDLMKSLESLVGGTEKPQLVIHLPGFNEETVRQTPLLELYEAGVRYRKKLQTLVTEAAGGRAHPEQIDAFQAQNGYTLEAADAWLTAVLAGGQSGLGAQLRIMSPAAILDELLKTESFIAHQVESGQSAALWESLRASIGLPADWPDTVLSSEQMRAEDAAFAAAGWCLCVEYADDLLRPPVADILQGASDLPPAVIGNARKAAAHMRDRHTAFYKRTADETESMLAEEVESAKAEDLGNVDTFRFEEDTILQAALGELAAGEWDKAAEWASRRIGSDSKLGSYWLREDPTRESAWQLIGQASALGQAVTRAGPRLTAQSLEAAVDLYLEGGATVDRAHRKLEQARRRRLHPQVAEFEKLRTQLDEMRRVWREWADAWALDFNNLCRSRGFLPEAGQQQRTIFDQVVRPMTQQPGTTALFLVDALRFEMAEELQRELSAESSATVHLKARLAELPSVSAVGMNVLAPVFSGGRLTAAVSDPDGGRFLGFSTGEFRVSNPESRKRAMHDRVGGAHCPWLTLEEAVSRESSSLKRAVAQARLVVVHSLEIDNAGESGVGPEAFDSMIGKLRTAWRLLRDAGVRRFVFTSDHGFLLHDDTAPSALSHGRKIDPHRRYVLSSQGADHAGEVRVSLTDLGYEGVEGYLMFPETTAVFDKGRSTVNFVHGGNSLQERLVPVLTAVYRSAAGSVATIRYALSAAARESVAGMYCIEGKVELAEQNAFAFAGPEAVEISLRVPESESVRAELCQVRGNATLAGDVVSATVKKKFELFFRLWGPEPSRVPVELYHAGRRFEVTPFRLPERFEVAAPRGRPDAASTAPTAKEPASRSEPWLRELPEGGVRDVFEHLGAHGSVTEIEANRMLGGARQQRVFARKFEAYAKKAPFRARVESVAGVKRYVREGKKP